MLERHSAISSLQSLRVQRSLSAIAQYRSPINHDALGPLPYLTELSCNNMTSVSTFSSLTNLRALSCCNCNGIEVNCFRGMTNLRQLDCAGNAQLTEASFADLEALERLDCWSSVAALPPNLHSLTSLRCSFEPRADWQLRKLTELLLLDMKGAAAGTFAGMTALQLLHMTGDAVIPAGCLTPLRHLRFLTCYSAFIHEGALSELFALRTLLCESAVLKLSVSVR